MAYHAFDLSGKTAIVTGGNSGIGLGMVAALAAAGQLPRISAGLLFIWPATPVSTTPGIHLSSVVDIRCFSPKK